MKKRLLTKLNLLLLFLMLISFYVFVQGAEAVERPSRPTEVFVSQGTSAGGIRISWSAVADAESYGVYRIDRSDLDTLVATSIYIGTA